MTQEDSDEPLLALCGYHSDFGRNLVSVVAVLSVLGLTVLILTVFPYMIYRHRGTKRYAAWVCNFSLRFFYQLLFEICLCLLIHFKTGGKQGRFNWTLAILYAAMVTVLIVFLFTRLFRFGPTLRGLYERGTLLKSFWAVRPLAPETNARRD